MTVVESLDLQLPLVLAWFNLCFLGLCLGIPLDVSDWAPPNILTPGGLSFDPPKRLPMYPHTRHLFHNWETSFPWVGTTTTSPAGMYEAWLVHSVFVLRHVRQGMQKPRCRRTTTSTVKRPTEF